MSAVSNVIPLFRNGHPNQKRKDESEHNTAARKQIPTVGLQRELLSVFVQALNESDSLTDLDEIEAIYAAARTSIDPVVLNHAIRYIVERTVTQILTAHN